MSAVRYPLTQAAFSAELEAIQKDIRKFEALTFKLRDSDEFIVAAPLLSASMLYIADFFSKKAAILSLPVLAGFSFLVSGRANIRYEFEDQLIKLIRIYREYLNRNAANTHDPRVILLAEAIAPYVSLKTLVRWKDKNAPVSEKFAEILAHRKTLPTESAPASRCQGIQAYNQSQVQNKLKQNKLANAAKYGLFTCLQARAVLSFYGLEEESERKVSRP